MSQDGTFRGATLDEALSTACGELRARVGELHYEVQSDADGDGGVVIHAEVDPVAVLGLFLSETFRAGELELSAQLTPGNESLDGELSGGDQRILTGSGGRGLDALQYTDGFKARRAVQLRERAEAAADEALSKRSSVVLGPLTPAARREIHLALADDPGVETESDGEGFLKRVVIRPRRRR